MVYSQDEYERIGNLQELGTIDNLNGLLTSYLHFDQHQLIHCWER